VRELGLPPFVAELLCRRGFSTPALASPFLEPRLKTLSDPFLLPNMEAAVQRLLAAIDARERIVLYGDYDVDGVTSLAIFTRVLQAYGATVASFLPSRMEEGYGLSHDGVRRCVEEHRPQLLVAVDCGTSSVAEIAALRRDGVDVLVFDHHEPKSALPADATIVNPKLGGDFHYLCSAGLAFKAAHALLKRRPRPEFDLKCVLDLVALGTVADLVPLVAENRILVKRGLLQLAETRWPGVRALMAKAVVRPPLCAADVGFKLGPRMNAAGRLGTAQEALELLLTADPARAVVLAERLDAQNRERRAVEDGVLKAAEAQVEEWFRPAEHAAVVAGDDGWHPGVVGIVASRLSKRLHRPAIVVGFDAAGVGKGSCRSISGYSLVQALGECAAHLEKHGGHEMAAGLTVQRARFEAFRAAFGAHARGALSAEQLEPRLHLDAELPLSEVDFSVLDHHDLLQPFGAANFQPVFYARGVTLAAPPRVMKEKHLSFHFRHRGSAARGVWFGGAVHTLPPPPWDVAFTVDRHEYEGEVSAQLLVTAVRAAGG
jgi:single-stranded-DNA-specific exonuclease